MNKIHPSESLEKTASKLDEKSRKLIAENPELILNDKALMDKLLSAGSYHQEAKNPRKLVDLRAVAMQHIENENRYLRQANREVVSVSYYNTKHNHQIYEIILRLLEVNNLAQLSQLIDDELSPILGIRSAHIYFIKKTLVSPPKNLRFLSHADFSQYLHLDSDKAIRGRLFSTPERIESYNGFFRFNDMNRDIILRPYVQSLIGQKIYGKEAAATLGSEAIATLNLVPKLDRFSPKHAHIPAMFLFASNDSQHFNPNLSKDLLGYFIAGIERIISGLIS